MMETRFLRVGWMFDGKGGPAQQKRLLRLQGDRIAAIEEDPGAAERLQGQVVDLSQCTILPPLVDGHVHLFMSATSERERRVAQLSADYGQLLPAMTCHAEAFLAHGVLAARDGGDQGGYALAFRATAAMPQKLTLKVAGRGWHREGRYGRIIGRSPRAAEALAEAVAGEEQAVDQVKIVNSGFNSLKTFGLETKTQYDAEELGAAVRVAARCGRKVMVHANGREPVRNALLAGCHSIEHGFFMGRENLQLMADSATFLVPTACTMQAFLDNFAALGAEAERSVIEATLHHQLEQLALAHRLGVKVAIGTDAGSLGVHHGRSVAEEMRLLIAAGFTTGEAVAAATSIGARLLGLPGSVTLEKGGPATFLVVEGDARDLPRRLPQLHAISIDGNVVSPLPFNSPASPAS